MRLHRATDEIVGSCMVKFQLEPSFDVEELGNNTAAAATSGFVGAKMVMSIGDVDTGWKTGRESEAGDVSGKGKREDEVCLGAPGASIVHGSKYLKIVLH